MAVSPIPSARPTFLQSDRVLARAAQPFVRFLHIEAAGGILLVAATIVALIWANSPWQASYESFWSTNIRLEVGSYVFEEDLAPCRQRLVDGGVLLRRRDGDQARAGRRELRDRRSVALPAMAALGGMIVPAAHLHGVQRRW